MTAETAQDSARPGGRWKKAAGALILLVLVALVAFFGVRRIRERLKPLPPPRQPALAVETVKVTAAPFVVSRRYAGSIVAARRALISAQVSARVEAILHREGETVAKGDLLVALDDSQLRAEVGRLEATGSRIRADLDFWIAQDKRDEKLFRAKVIPPQKRDESRRMVASLKASLKANDYALAAARVRLAYTRIRAPFAGAIQRLATEVGEQATAGKMLLELVATRPLKLVFAVPQKDLAALVSRPENTASARAAEVLVRVPFLSRIIHTRIAHVYPALDDVTRNATCDAELTENLAGLRPGMTVEAVVILERQAKALAVPRSAVRNRKDGPGIYLVQDQVAVWQPVTTGRSQDGLVRIVSGLEGGETVIVTPDPRLKDGIRVRPVSTWSSDR